MIRGFYTAASGMYTQQKKANVLSNNMANIGTAGYKKDRLISTTFNQELVMRLEKGNPENFGRFDIITHPDEVHTDYAQSDFDITNRPYDMSILGEGFFVVKTDDGKELLTRNGQFDIDAKGCLILRGVGKVQSNRGDIKLPKSDFIVSADGTITTSDGKDFQLKIVMPENKDTLSNAYNGTFTDSAPKKQKQLKAGFEIMQGAYERSNVDVSEEMTRIIEAQRTFQSCGQMVRMIDASESKLLEKIGSGR